MRAAAVDDAHMGAVAGEKDFVGSAAACFADTEGRDVVADTLGLVGATSGVSTEVFINNLDSARSSSRVTLQLASVMTASSASNVTRVMDLLPSTVEVLAKPVDRCAA